MNQNVQRYLKASRQARYSLLFALPLLLLYEGLAVALNQSALAGVRNGADVLLKTVFVGLGGRTGLHVFALVLAVWGVALVTSDYRKHPGPIRPGYWGVMLAESIVLAAVFGAVAVNLTGLILSGPITTVQGGTLDGMPLSAQLVVSLGAGLYEELLFRVILVAALLWAGSRLGLKKSANVTVAILGSALIFSAFHYVGPYGDQLTLGSFTFRAIAGVLLSGIYVARGFGIVAWTHAIYDIGYALTW